MSLKQKFQINDAAWNKTKSSFIRILWGIPFLASVFSFVTWPIITNLSWCSAVTIPCAILYVMCIVLYSQYLTQSKYTLFFSTCVVSLFVWGMIIIADACCYRFFGTTGLLIQNLVLIPTGIFLCIHYYYYWSKVWDSHKKHNETVMMDLVNGRYDCLNNFNLDEKNDKKAKKQRPSIAALSGLALQIAPVGVVIGTLFSRHGNYSVPCAICWPLSFAVAIGCFKLIMAGFIHSSKLSQYEKKIGKPIINGLL